MFAEPAMPDTIEKRRGPVVCLAVLVVSWLLLFAVQALQLPLDGFMLAHVSAPGASWLSGPLLATGLTDLLPLSKVLPSLHIAYLFLLVAVPVFSIVVIGRLMRKGAVLSGASRRGGLLLGAAILLAVVAIGDLPYLSNDVYLYRTQGQMLHQVGVNPYRIAPAQVLPPDQLQNVPWRSQLCTYGPLALDGFQAATAGSAGIVADFWRLKILLALPLVAVLLLLAFLRRFDHRERVAGIAWIGLNPLLLLEVCQNAHLEGWIGLLLVLLLLALDRRSYGRAVAAGVLCGLACAVKLSLLVVAPIIVVWLWTGRGARIRWWVAAIWTVLFVLACGATLVALYFRFWHGVHTFDGLQQEAGKVIRSLYAMLGALFGMKPGWIHLCSLAGSLLAAVIGVWVCVRRGSLSLGVLVCLMVQAVLGRTFLQPWHFCPALMLVPFLGVAARAAPGADGAALAPGVSRLATLRSYLVLSVSSLAGGYAVLLYDRGNRADILQLISFLCMVLPPMIWWSADVLIVRVTKKR